MFKLFKAKDEAGRNHAEHLPKPRDILEPIGRALVIEQDQDPDWVWRLKCVVRPLAGNNDRQEFRVYDPNQAARARLGVKDYNSFEQNPELILFSGWIDKKTRAMEMVDARVSQKAV